MRGLTRSTSVKRVSALHRTWPLGLLLAACVGCGVDDRELQLVTFPYGGTAAGGSNSGGTGSGAPASGAQPGLNAPPPPVCNYAPSGPDEGCETLVTNPGFDQLQGVVGWPGATILIQTLWEKKDATGIPQSGSMAVTNALTAPEKGETINGALQCVPAEAGAVYDVLADVLIPKQEAEGRAGISILFYKTTDCNASGVGTDMSVTTDLLDLMDQWQPVGTRFIVPSGMKSMEVTLVAAKSFSEPPITAVFDNVYVQKR